MTHGLQKEQGHTLSFSNRPVILTALAVLFALFMLPALLFGQGLYVPIPAQLPAEPVPQTTQQVTETADLQLSSLCTVDSSTTVTVRMDDGTVETLTMAEYLWGVVAAEMPASFQLEALKAQTVAARTYSYSKMTTGQNANHTDADLCTDINCCQAYLSTADAISLWGDSYTLYRDKIVSAIAETDGEVLWYDGQPIQAVFFSSAAGQTSDAVEVWGNALPYLTGVSSPEGENVPNYYSQEEFSLDTFRSLILAQYPSADLSGAPSTWLGSTTLSTSGSVANISIGGVAIKGTELRQILGLRSTHFSVEITADSVIFSVTGYGHGVGMSQYGANAMAEAGSSYRDILLWYYTDVTLSQ